MEKNTMTENTKHHLRRLVRLLMQYEFEFDMSYINEEYCLHTIFGNQEYVVKTDLDIFELIDDLEDYYIPALRPFDDD